jgi:hypothetical protein
MNYSALEVAELVFQLAREFGLVVAEVRDALRGDHPELDRHLADVAHDFDEVRAAALTRAAKS